MTTAITFSRQNGAGSRARTTQYWEKFVLVVVIVVESKDLYYGFWGGRLFEEIQTDQSQGNLW